MSTARSAVYNLLALPLTPPEPAAWAPICTGEWASALAAALRGQGAGLNLPPTLGARPFAVAEMEYHRAFQPPCLLHPIESVHKPWTTQPDAALPIARQKGWLGGDAAAHLRSLFAAAGVSIPAGWEPDHLALELELMGLLLESGANEQAELFRAQHLDWLEELAAEARRPEVPAFYCDLVELIAAWVKADQATC